MSSAYPVITKCPLNMHILKTIYTQPISDISHGSKSCMMMGWDDLIPLTNHMAHDLVQRIEHKLHKAAVRSRPRGLTAEAPRVLVEVDVAPEATGKFAAGRGKG